MPVLLNVEHLRKHFGPEPVLADVTFQVRTGDKIGLVGPNGCGKTTLLNILVGREETERGSIERLGDITLGYLEQRPDIVTDRTVLEEAKIALEALVATQKEAERIAILISETTDTDEHERLAKKYDRLHEELMRKDAYNLEYRVEMILHGVGFRDEDMSKKLVMLSGGELNRLSLAKLLLAEPDIMLLDEPSNHLDLLATEWLEDFLSKTSAAVILVSHDRYFLDRVTNRTFELFMGTVDDFPGNFTKYQMLKEERLAVQTRTYEKYIEEVEKAKDFIRRHHYGMKAAQAEDRRKKLERLEEEPADLPRKITTPGMRFPAASRTGDLTFRIEGLSKGFGFPLFQNLTLDIQRGQRWAIIGPNGCGKSTFLKCLLGEEQPDSGRVQFGEGVKVGYFDQQIKVLDGSLPVVEAIRPQGKVFEDLQRRNLLGSFGLSGDQQLQAVESLSGGQRCRAALAKLSAEDPNVMILDEPTNHLDLWAREALEKALKQYDGTVIFISHDRYFVDQVADHLLIIQPDARFRVLDGNYSTFRYMVSKGLVADPFLPDALADKPVTSSVQSEKKTVDILKRSSKASSAPASVPLTPLPKNGGKKKKSGAVPVLDEKNIPGLKSLSKKDRDEKHAEAAFKEEQGRSVKKPKEKRKRKFPYRKVRDIEEEVFIRETQVMTLQEELLDPNVLRDGDRVRELHQQIQEEEAALKILYEHWEEATELNG